MSDIHTASNRDAKTTNNTDSKQNIAEVDKTKTALDEEQVLDFWNENNIFEKSISQRDGMDEFVFFDGPPFATGLPHYGHLLPGTIKDVIPRYQTMRGKQVVRKWGWDCHGLPIENIIEKKLDLNSRKDILDYGIKNFNEDCRAQVLEYKDAWEQIIPRTGRWVDMQDHYKTMDASYTESAWWAFKQLHEKELVYKGYKPMHLCPRCETTLSNNEVSEGYQDITDISVTAKFELVDEPGTFLLAWTTTPWTLPGNTAIAVGTGVVYVKVEATNKEGVTEKYIVAQARLEDVMNHAGITKWEELAVLGVDALVGRSYTPPYDYFAKETEIENHENGWKIWEAEFVNDEAGTGIAHESPAYGADDYHLAIKNKIPVIHHVGMNGQYIDAVTDFAGLHVKQKGDHMSTDIEIIKDLAGKGLLFSKEKLVHSYPHCWRCDTPLLNYATSSWFIEATKTRSRMLEENTATKWVPDHLGHKRFHNWIENNVDWAVSRSRFWGAPLPIWENQTTGEYDVMGSVSDLKEKTRSTNNFIFIRHGESVGNVSKLISMDIDDENDRLTENGKEQVQASVEEINKLLADSIVNETRGVDLIIHSPYNRTKQTASMIAQSFGVTDMLEDDRIRERYFGDGLSGTEYDEYHKILDEKGVMQDYNFTMPGGETYYDVKRRMMDFMYDIDAQYEGKTIVVVTHFTPYWVSCAGAEGMDNEQMHELRDNWGTVHNAKPRVVDFAPFPHNDDYELDFHRPYSDNVTYKNEAGQEYKMIGDVFDCWYESGSMPFASKGYMGEGTGKDFKYPADFICEAIDQTRGWFYSLLALGAGVFDQAPMKNVIVTGHVMAEDGKKMSKSLNNYPPVTDVLNKYGADSLRYFLLNSPVIRGEKVNLVEKEIDEVQKKIVMRLKNTLAFYQMYSEGYDASVDCHTSPHPLDQWIMARVHQTVDTATTGLDQYELDRACNPFLEFVDDLSTWYLRRSRDRFKSDDEVDRKYAQATIVHVLKEFAQVLAPFMPFTSEYLWQELKSEHDMESVHLSHWPKVGTIDVNALEQMQYIRDLVSTALEARVSAGIKVRQPLAKLSVQEQKDVTEHISSALLEIVQDELNVKAVEFEAIEEAVKLDTVITPELQTEGDFREFLRQVQSLRKQMKMSPHDNVQMKLVMDESGQNMIKQYFSDLEHTAGVAEVDFIEVLDTEEMSANEVVYKVQIEKI